MIEPFLGEAAGGASIHPAIHAEVSEGAVRCGVLQMPGSPPAFRTGIPVRGFERANSLIQPDIFIEDGGESEPDLGKLDAQIGDRPLELSVFQRFVNRV